MTAAIIQFVVSSVVIVASAIGLTRCADQIARITGLGHLVVGSILLAAATSLPELSVNWAIVSLEMPNMAVGGLIGSSLLNLGILAIADLTHKARGISFSRKAVENALPGVVSIGMTSVVGVGIFVGDRLGSLEFLGLGLFSMVILAAYFIGLRLIYQDQLTAKEPRPSKKSDSGENRSAALIRAISGMAIAVICILIASPYAASAAEKIAGGSGLGNTFVGTTFVALVTSLPELVACIAAARIGAINLAIGNVFGSNIFNLLLLVPLDIAHPGALIGSVDQVHVLTCLLIGVVTSVVIIGQLYRVESRKLLIEPDAMLVLLLVAANLVLIYYCK